MQYIIEIRPDQDLPFLLTLLEKMQVVVRPVDVPKSKKNGHKPSEKYFGKLSTETADVMVAHQIVKAESPYPSKTIGSLLAALGDFTDEQMADDIEEAQKNWKNWTIETW